STTGLVSPTRTDLALAMNVCVIRASMAGMAKAMARTTRRMIPAFFMEPNRAAAYGVRAACCRCRTWLASPKRQQAARTPYASRNRTGIDQSCDQGLTEPPENLLSARTGDKFDVPGTMSCDPAQKPQHD